MIYRFSTKILFRLLQAFPVVALLGSRQVGKTTLALEIARTGTRQTSYLDLERDTDLAKLDEPQLYLEQQAGRLVIIDEIQRRPDLFPLLRSLVDERIRAGEKAGQFLILGSASRDLLQQSSESLAGRIAYMELTPFSIKELADRDKEFDINRLWLRGGFPGSYLAGDDDLSWEWRTNFIATYLERDIPQLGPRLPAERMRRLWAMLAFSQGSQLNISRLAGSLGVTGRTVRHYLDVLTDLYMVRQLQPWSGNSRKRLVKTPKVYVRDSGLTHRLANITDFDVLLGNPLCGGSWEGFVIENLLNHLSDKWTPGYYRTSAQAEIDLVLEGPGGEVIAIEIKRTAKPKPSRGFRNGTEDIAATRQFIVAPIADRFPAGPHSEAIGVIELINLLLEY